MLVKIINHFHPNYLAFIISKTEENQTAPNDVQIQNDQIENFTFDCPFTGTRLDKSNTTALYHRHNDKYFVYLVSNSGYAKLMKDDPVLFPLNQVEMKNMTTVKLAEMIMDDIKSYFEAMSRDDREKVLSMFGNLHQNLTEQEKQEAAAVERKQRRLLRKYATNLPKIGPEFLITPHTWMQMEKVVSLLCRITTCKLYEDFLNEMEYADSSFKEDCAEGKMIIDVCIVLRALIVDGVYDEDKYFLFKREWFQESGRYYCLVKYLGKHKDEFITKAHARLDLIARLEKSREELDEEEVQFLFERHAKGPVSDDEAGPAEPPQQRQRLASNF